MPRHSVCKDGARSSLVSDDPEVQRTLVEVVMANQAVPTGQHTKDSKGFWPMQVFPMMEKRKENQRCRGETDETIKRVHAAQPTKHMLVYLMLAAHI